MVRAPLRAGRLTRAIAGSVAAVLLLAGCAAGQVSQTADQVPAVDGGSGTSGAIGVRDALLAPSPSDTGYAKGANVPMLLWITNSSNSVSDTLTGATSTAAGSVKVSGTATIGPQSATQITASSAITVTLTGLTAAIPYGFSVPVTFSFAQAGNITLNVPIEIPQERGSRSRIDVEPTEPSNVFQTEDTSNPPALSQSNPG